MSLATWIRGRKTVASATALAVLIAAPVTVAVLHDGFPVSNLDLKALDVWVTSQHDKLAARFNTQITDLDSGGVPPSSDSFDVLQNGNDVFLTEAGGKTVARINSAASATNKESFTAGTEWQEEFGGGRLAVLSSTGKLWIVDGTTVLAFDPRSKELATFGPGSVVAVGQDGTVAVASGKDRKLYVIPAGSTTKRSQGGTLPGTGKLEVTVVGDRAVALGGDHLLWDDGSLVTVGRSALQLQQPGPAADTVVVATDNALLSVGTDKVRSRTYATNPGATDSSAKPENVAAPVNVNGCVHGAWTDSARYLALCEGQPAFKKTLTLKAGGTHQLQFRVNQDVVALNDVVAGDVWLITPGAIVNAKVDWTKVRPPDDKDAQESTNTTSVPSFTPQAPKPKDQNHDPVAHPDELGARPGGSAILNVLANDTDEDGDVLTVIGFDQPPSGQGTLTAINGGRALQYTSPADGSTGGFTSQYTVSDGRGGQATSTVKVTFDGTADNPPRAFPGTTSAVIVEPGKTVKYNVLADWYDPNGDDLILEDAQAPTGTVHFSPDGLITYTAGAQVGPTTIAIKVGETVPQGLTTLPPVDGSLYVDVKAAGSNPPITSPDFAAATIGESTKVLPLANDLSPSGVPLTLGEVKLAVGAASSLSFTTNPSDNSVTLTGGAPGSYYLSYIAAAGDKSQTDYIRFDVVKAASKDDGPTAVRDVAYLRPDEPVTVPVLDNDISPSGAILGIVGVDVDPGSGLSVQVLTGALIKITAPSGLTRPTEFSYTISDGIQSHQSSTARVSVVPLPKVTNPQQPITADDSVTVRVGATVSVDVLANDYSPDGSLMHLSPDLTNVQVGNGFPFVSGDRVRLQAPTKAGNSYSLTYTVTDDNGQSNTARVNYLVTDDTKNNKPPVPPLLTARVFTGGTLKVDVPLDGMDPDGDPVTLVGVVGSSLGTVTGQNASSFTYIAPPIGSPGGTDTFTYEVKDQPGLTAQGTVKIAVLPAPTTSLAPSAVSDYVSIKPDQVSTVPVLSNDSDPNGYTIRFDPTKKLDVQKPLAAQIKGGVIVVTAPHKPGDYQVHYFIDNNHKAHADAYLKVHVDPKAPPQAPVVFDQTVDPTAAVGKHTVKVDVLHDAQNLDGLVSDLTVTAVGINSALAKPNKDGTVTVTLGSEPQTIAYQVENRSKLTAKAVISVPAYLDSLPPYLRPDFTYLEVNVGETKTVDVKDILVVPSRRDPKIIDLGSATSPEQKPKTPLAISATQLSFTPTNGFVGKTFLTFRVSDKGLANDPNAATIQVPVLVKDPHQQTVAPTFANQTIEVEVGKSKTFNLRDATSHPDPQVLKAVKYDFPPPPSGPVSYSFDGNQTLTLKVDKTAKLPGPITINFTMVSGSLSSSGRLIIKPVATTAPPPQTVDDTKTDADPNATFPVPVLANDFDPFAGQKDGSGLTLDTVVAQGDTLGGSARVDGNAIAVTTGSAKSGTISFVYTMHDVLDRSATGRLTVIVTSAPEPVTNFTLSNPASQRIAVDFGPPTSNNGQPITGYVVRIADSNGTTTRTDCTAGATCTFDNRANGATQTVDISATNSRGTTWSATKTITPYGTPSTPVNPVIDTNSSTATATIQPVWGAPADAGGGSLHYEWNYTSPSEGTQSTTSTSGPNRNVGPGSYVFQVRACNPGGCSAYSTSPTRQISPPPPSASVSDGGDRSGKAGYHWLKLNVANFPAGSYTIKCYADGTNGGTTAYSSETVSVPANGSLITTCDGTVTDTSNPGWFMIEIVGVMYTPHYTPWT